MDVMSQFNLPNYLKGKTFAEASKILDDKFKDRTDPESIATKNEMHGKLKEAQEFVKAKQQELSKPSHQMPDGSTMAGASHGANSMNEGGPIGLAAEAAGKGPKDIMGAAMGAKGLVDLFNSKNIDTSGATAPAEKDVFGNVMKGAEGGAKIGKLAGPLGEGIGMAVGGLFGAFSGPSKSDMAKAKANNTYAQIQGNAPSNVARFGLDLDPTDPDPDAPVVGNPFEDWNEMESGHGVTRNDKVGDPMGWLNNEFLPKRPSGVGNGAGQHVLSNNNPLPDPMAWLNDDPWLKNYDPIGSTKSLNTVKDFNDTTGNKTVKDNVTPEDTTFDFQSQNNDFVSAQNEGGPYATAEDNGFSTNEAGETVYTDPAKPNEISDERVAAVTGMNNYANANNPSPKKVGDNKFSLASALRYAPAAMNIAQLASLKKPEDVAFGRSNRKYDQQLVDEQGLQNTVRQATASNRDALLSSAGGSSSKARAALLASQLQGTKALSQAYQQAGAENRQEGRAAQQFDSNTERFNIGQDDKSQVTNLQQNAAYESNKSRLLSQIGNDLGGIGQEELFKKYPELAGLGYDSKGRKIKK